MQARPAHRRSALWEAEWPGRTPRSFCVRPAAEWPGSLSVAARVCLPPAHVGVPASPPSCPHVLVSVCVCVCDSLLQMKFHTLAGDANGPAVLETALSSGVKWALTRAAATSPPRCRSPGGGKQAPRGRSAASLVTAPNANNPGPPPTTEEGALVSPHRGSLSHREDGTTTS